MAHNSRAQRDRRKMRIRRKVSGTAERPRLSIYRSLSHIYVQVVDDQSHRVLASASTAGKTASEELSGLSKTERAQKVGTKVAQLCKQKGIDRIVFDRSGYRYHGRISALAAAAREGGLEF